MTSRSIPPRSRYLGLCLTLALLPLPAMAQQDGKWKADVTTGDWWTASNWEDDEVADGSLATASFETATASTTFNVTLSSNATVGVLTNYSPGSGGLILSGPGVLTLDGGGLVSPVVKLNKATINAVLAGSEGVIFTTAGGVNGTSLQLMGSNTYTGITTITSGIVTAGHNNAFGLGVSEDADYIALAPSNASIMVQSGVTINKTLRISGQGVNSTQGPALYSGGTGVATWAGNIFLDGLVDNRIGGGASAQNGAIKGELIISGVIADGLGKSLQVNRANGIVTLSGKNTYTGETGLYRGTLRIAGGDDRLPTTTVLRAMTTTAADFDLNGFNQEVARISVDAAATNKKITNSGTTRSTLTVSGDLDSDAIDYTGNLNLAKLGAGNLTVGEGSSYQGNTFVGEGQLTLAGFVLNDESNVTLSLGATIGFASSLEGGVDTIGAFIYDGTSLALGTHGGLNSGAQYEHAFIFGDGYFLVTNVIPEPSSLAFAFGGAGLLALFRRRRKS